MYFKQIEMAGFKSFADRIDIRFENGVTAIVGPNGCGKSNVSDAIRWVLGEQSSKNLRGTSMQDVIFNGTEKRKSLSYCEVTLTFNNQDRFFAFDYDELAITRKLYRSGESEYLLNRTPCRLKDIINLLYDSGIGKDGYSIIGQGKVQEIIDAKPENRRFMFEEAAGISKFKSRKVEAERKLERTRDNLTRLKDITSEIERQMGPLKKQSENAKKFLELKNALKDLEVNAYVYQYENANEQKSKINLKLSAILEELNLRQGEFEQASKNYDSSMLSLENFDKILSSLHEKVLTLTVGLEKQAGETKVLRERINFKNAENDRVNLNISNSEKLSQAFKTQIHELEIKLVDLESKKESLTKAYEEVSDEYLKIVDDLTLSEDEEGQNQKKIIDNLGSLSDIKSELSKLAAEKELMQSTKLSLVQKVAEIEKRIFISHGNVESTNTYIENIIKECENIKADCDACFSKVFVMEKTLKDEEAEGHNLQTSIQVYENRKRLLSEMQAEYEGYSIGVKKILRESERNSEISRNVKGVLASLIKVPEKFETAIEVALGNAVQNIVTFNENGAKDLISYLKVNQLGRATFLPITTMRPRNVSPEARRMLTKKGVFGIASELIAYESEINSVISNLLGATIICETLDDAVALAKDTSFSFKIVTLDGDVVNPQGSMTGGSKKSEAVNLISRAREIETLEKEIESKKKRQIEIKETLNVKVLELQNFKKEFEIFQKNKNEREIELATAREKVLSFKEMLESLNEEKNATNQEIQTLKNKIEFIEKDILEVSVAANALNGSSKDVNLILEKRKEKYLHLKSKRDSLNTNMTTVKIELNSVINNIEFNENEKIRLKNELSKQYEILEESKIILSKNIRDIEESELIINEQIEKAPLTESKLELENVKAKMMSLESQKKEIQENIKRLNDDKSNLMEEISKINDRKFKEEMNLSKVDTDIESMQERIYEEYQLTYATCLEFRRPDFDMHVAMPEINKIRKEISGLGYVNVNAIEDCKVLLERYTDLSTQAEDLTKAEEDLTQIISDLSSEMVSRFDTEFNKINENFKITFRELFGGGNARLELTESNNPLEAGVDIVAEPPGKKLQNITLLSGGEKALTAIAILFAILKLKPLPFCLLDEIEAALDDANVERFAQYLRRFSSGTQFIVITHRKPTMELADALYGVTMEEKGVSKMVSVKLSEAVKAVEANK